MKCTLSEIRNKEIISIRTGTKLGFADDVEIDTETLELKAIIIYGRSRLLGLLGRDEDIMISADNVRIIGTDTVLVTEEKYIYTKNVSDVKENSFRTTG